MSWVCNTLLVFSGEINNGIKKEPLAKDTPRLWINDGIKMQTFSHSLVNALLIYNKKRVRQIVPHQMCALSLQKHPGIKEEDEPEEEEEEELGHAETYAEYMPMKRKCFPCLICMFRSKINYRTVAPEQSWHPVTDQPASPCSEGWPPASRSRGGDQLPVQRQPS